MRDARQLLDTSPRDFHLDAQVLAATIDRVVGRRAGLHRRRR